jgi:hypothetical protein
LATSDDEVDLVVSLLECTIGVAPFGQWWRRPLLPVVVLSIVVVLATLIIVSVVVTIIVAIVTLITSVTPVGAVIATVVVASVIAVVVAAIITSIPIVVARIGPTVMVISSIRSTVMIVKAFTTIVVVVVVAPSLLGGRWYSKGTLLLLALPHGVLGVTVELALVIYDHIEVTFKEGGRSWWICEDHVWFEDRWMVACLCDE